MSEERFGRVFWASTSIFVQCALFEDVQTKNRAHPMYLGERAENYQSFKRVFAYFVYYCSVHTSVAMEARQDKCRRFRRSNLMSHDDQFAWDAPVYMMKMRMGMILAI